MRRAAAVWRGRPHLDLRGDLLVVFGTLEISYGIANVSNARFGVVRGVGVLIHRHLPMQLWGSLWIATGLTAVVTALLAIRRPAWDRIGYAALMGPLLLWSAATAAAWWTGTYPQAWSSTTTWGLMAAGIGKINAHCPHTRRHRDRT